MTTYTSVSIVEDSDPIRKRLIEAINETEDLYCVASYENAETALSGLLEVKPSLVIMDIGLPGMNGIECMMKVKSRSPEMSFLMFTVFDNDKNIFDALKAGASGYIMKDERPSGVIKAIRQYLAGGGPMSSHIAKRVMESFHHFNNKNPNAEILTEHQFKILRMISDGLLNKEIAYQLNILEGSVKVQISRIYKKLQVNNRVEAVKKFLEHD